jgi:hypothetical protein
MSSKATEWASEQPLDGRKKQLLLAIARAVVLKEIASAHRLNQFRSGRRTSER